MFSELKTTKTKNLPSAHYVDNATFFEAIKEYQNRVRECANSNTPVPRIPEYIGECFLRIATKFSFVNNGKMSFVNYTYRDDMILDGIENCIRAIHSFDPTKGSNPFSYFTQIIFFAFLRRIDKEKKQTKIRNALISNMDIDSFNTQDQDDDTEYRNSFVEYVKANMELDENMFVLAKKSKKQHRSTSTDLQDFFV